MYQGKVSQISEESYLAIAGIDESWYVLSGEILIHMRERSQAVIATLRAEAKEEM